MTSPFPVDAPELFSVGTEAIVERSKHLGLVWTRRLATVISAGDPASVTIRFDADTVDESAVSMVGGLPEGARVYVDIVPPGGNFIVGAVSGTNQLVNRISSVTSTGAIGAEAVVLTGTKFPWGAGRAYEVTFAQETSGSVASNTAFFTVRRTNLAGAIKFGAAFLMNTVIGTSQHCEARFIIRNGGTSTLIDNLVLTLQTVGAGTVTGAGGGAFSFVRYLEIREAGVAADYPNAVQI